MSRRTPLILVSFVAAAFASGCGGSTLSTSHDQRPGTSAQSAPATGGLRVGATDLRLGDATLATDTGVRRLRVPHRRIDPDALRRHGANRQGVGAGATCPDQDLLPDGNNTAAIVNSTLCLINGARADAGLPPLTTDSKLAAAALEHSQDMVAHQYFSHVALDGRDVVDRIRATGYIPSDAAWTVGENLAWGTGTLASPRNIMTAWMNSQGHRENILRTTFKQIGFGVVTGNPNSPDGSGATYTTNFGAIDGSGSDAPASQPVAAAPPASAASTVRTARSSASVRARRRARAARLHERHLRAKAMRAARRHAA